MVIYSSIFHREIIFFRQNWNIFIKCELARFFTSPTLDGEFNACRGIRYRFSLRQTFNSPTVSRFVVCKTRNYTPYSMKSYKTAKLNEILHCIEGFCVFSFYHSCRYTSIGLIKPSWEVWVLVRISSLFWWKISIWICWYIWEFSMRHNQWPGFQTLQSHLFPRDRRWQTHSQ